MSGDQDNVALDSWGGIPDTSDHGDEQKRQLIASDSDMIAVPRSLLGAAAYCVRQQAGSDSETYRALKKAAMSPAPRTFAGRNLADLQSGQWHPGDEA